jgi:hypothetical protein
MQLVKRQHVLNGGECISVDHYETSMDKFVCIYSKEFTGDRCEIKRTKLMIIFDKNISLPSSIYVHFIEAKVNALPIRTTTFKKILSHQRFDHCLLIITIPSYIY